jgi:hypothetical protein
MASAMRAAALQDRLGKVTLLSIRAFSSVGIESSGWLPHLAMASGTELELKELNPTTCR